MTLGLLASITHLLMTTRSGHTWQFIPTNDLTNNGSGRMTKPTMPRVHGGLGGTAHNLPGMARVVREGVKATSTSASKDRSLRDLILNKKELRMKFKVNIIVSGETMNRY